MMSHNIDRETLMVLLDSNLPESEKVELVRQYRNEQSTEVVVAMAKAISKAFSRLFEQVVNHRAIQQVFSSPLLREKH